MWKKQCKVSVDPLCATSRNVPSRSHQATCFQALVHLNAMFSPQALATALEKNSTITTINLGGNSIGVEGAKGGGRVLPECKHLCIGM